MTIDSISTIRIIQQEPDLFTKLLPYIGSFVGLMIGFLLGLLKDWIQVNSTFKKTRKYFFDCLYTLRQGVRNQIEFYEVYINGLKKETNIIPLFSIDSGFSLSAIQAVTINDMYKIFIVNGDEKIRNLYLIL